MKNILKYVFVILSIFCVCNVCAVEYKIGETYIHKKEDPDYWVRLTYTDGKSKYSANDSNGVSIHYITKSDGSKGAMFCIDPTQASANDGGEVKVTRILYGSSNNFTYAEADAKPFQWESNVFEYNTENPTKVIFVTPTRNDNGFYNGGWIIDYKNRQKP